MKDNRAIKVCAAVIRMNGKTLICTRPSGKHLENQWEFPGGKIQEGESDHECLRRELEEELGIKTLAADSIYELTYHYPEKTVYLRFYRVFINDPPDAITAMEGQNFMWADEEEMHRLNFVPADRPFLDFLSIHKS